METSTRRGFFGKLAAMAAAVAAAPKLFAQAPAAAPPAGAPPAGTAMTGGRRGGGMRGPGKALQNGMYYFSGTGSNDGYGRDSHITVDDAFETHVTRTMDALKKSVEARGSNMDSIVYCTVFLCLPNSDKTPRPTGNARFAAHKAQYDALNKIYGTYFSPGKAPSRACMALEWIPGDSLIEIQGACLVPPPEGSAPATPPAPGE
jgi:enamine deaminase RidA (YjgF/YER057c/UK114 family)